VDAAGTVGAVRFGVHLGVTDPRITSGDTLHRTVPVVVLVGSLLLRSVGGNVVPATAASTLHRQRVAVERRLAPGPTPGPIPAPPRGAGRSGRPGDPTGCRIPCPIYWPAGRRARPPVEGGPTTRPLRDSGAELPRAHRDPLFGAARPIGQVDPADWVARCRLPRRQPKFLGPPVVPDLGARTGRRQRSRARRRWTCRRMSSGWRSRCSAGRWCSAGSDCPSA
jgi:hypothetical protein